MSKQKKRKRIFKQPLTRKELEGGIAYGLSRELPAHQRLEFTKAMILGVDESKGDLSYAQSLAKKAQGFLTPKVESKLLEEIMALTEKAMLICDREMVTAAEAVTFIKDELMRNFVRTMILNLLIDHVLEVVEQSGSFTDEQRKEMRSYFHGMVGLDAFNEESQGHAMAVSNEEMAALLELSDEYTSRYSQDMTAEEATATIEGWKRKPVKYVLMSKVICVLFTILIEEPKRITQEQFDEIVSHIFSLTSRYIAYTTAHQVEVIA